MFVSYESRSSDTGHKGKRARQELAKLYKMAEVLHALPANVKLEMRNELILRSVGGGGLSPPIVVRFVKSVIK